MEQEAWKVWLPKLDINHLTLREVYDDLPGDPPDAISWKVKLLENPTSPFAFIGATNLARHDCIHILLSRGLLNQDEAFVLGFTMGTNKDIASWKPWMFKKLATYFYHSPYKFSKGDAIAFDLGLEYGKKCKCMKVFDIPLESDEYMSRTVGDLRKEFGIFIDDLKHYYSTEKLIVPDTVESKRL